MRISIQISTRVSILSRVSFHVDIVGGFGCKIVAEIGGKIVGKIVAKIVAKIVIKIGANIVAKLWPKLWLNFGRAQGGPQSSGEQAARAAPLSPTSSWLSSPV